MVFATATALIAVHVLNEAFISNEPGTSVADHLIGTAFCLGMLAAAWLAWTRFGAFLRGWLAVVLGVLAIARAVVALIEGGAVGFSGEEYTAVLLFPAGIVLMGLGAWTLWGGRSQAGSVRRRVGRRVAIGLAVLVAAFELVVPLVVALFYSNKPRNEVERIDFGPAYREVTLRTADGLDLGGWYVPSRNGAAVIAFPGRKSPRDHARMLARHGYGVLMLDQRGQGESEGEPTGTWDSSEDLRAATEFLHEQSDVRDGRVGGLGLSVGGEQMIQAAAENEDLRAVVSEGAGVRSVRDALIDPAPLDVVLMPGHALQTATMAALTGDLPPPALADLAPKIAPRPLFLIYAEKGQGGEHRNPAYFEAAREPKTLWRIVDGTHTDGLGQKPEEYERRVIAFFDRWLRSRE